MIEELYRFIKVAKNGNLTKTAEKLFITQSALTQSIQRLEKKVGTKLFSHQGKTLRLTADGTAVVEIGTKIIELWEKAKNPSTRQSLRPSYTIGAFDNAAIRLGRHFQNASSKDAYQLELVIGPSQKLLTQLQLGILDIAICVIDKKNLPPHDLMLLHTFKEELFPVASYIVKKNLKDIPFILYNKGSFTRQYLDAEFIKKGIAPKVFAESTSVTFMKELASLGCGIALLPENAVKSELKQKTLKKQKLSLTWHREYGIYIQKNGRLHKDHTVVQEITKHLPINK
jgi:DNA-binding transcriptional LysR family regulator